MQDRIGPNRVGPWGLFQPVADMLKLLLKEDVIPGHVNKLLYILAPGISVFTTMLAFAVVPFGPVPSNHLSPTDGQFPFIIAPGIGSWFGFRYFCGDQLGGLRHHPGWLGVQQ